MANIITNPTDTLEQWRLNLNSISNALGDPTTIYTTDGGDTFTHTSNLLASAINDLNTRKVKRSGDTIASLVVTTTLSVGGQGAFNVAQGTAPFTVVSTTPVANLNIGGNAATASAVAASGSLGTGVTATTPATGDNSTLVATTAFVKAQSYLTTTAAALTYAPLNSPTLVTPTLGVATATSINKVAFTQPATAATLTIADGKTLAVNNSIGLSGTDGTTMTFPATTDTIAGVGTTQTFTKPQRVTIVTNNTGTVDCNVTDVISCTPAAPITLTPANIPAAPTASQGYFMLYNSGGFAISKAANVKCDASFLGTVSTAGTYKVSFNTDGTNMYMTTSGALA